MSMGYNDRHIVAVSKTVITYSLNNKGASVTDDTPMTLLAESLITVSDKLVDEANSITKADRCEKIGEPHAKEAHRGLLKKPKFSVIADLGLALGGLIAGFTASPVIDFLLDGKEQPHGTYFLLVLISGLIFVGSGVYKYTKRI